MYAQEDCSYDKSSPKAIIGRTMVLNCTVPCFSGPFHFKWHQIFGDGSRELLNETSATLVVSEKKVTSAAEVGGRLYECNCSTTGSCRKYNISGISSRKPHMYIYVIQSCDSEIQVQGVIKIIATILTHISAFLHF